MSHYSPEGDDVVVPCVETGEVHGEVIGLTPAVGEVHNLSIRALLSTLDPHVFLWSRKPVRVL